MQPSSAILLKALGLSAFLIMLLWGLLPDMPWPVYPVLFVIVAAVIHPKMLADAANKRVVDDR